MLKNKLFSFGYGVVRQELTYKEFSKGIYVYMAGDMDTLINYVKESIAEIYLMRKANSRPEPTGWSVHSGEDGGFSLTVTPSMVKSAVERMNIRTTSR